MISTIELMQRINKMQQKEGRSIVAISHVASSTTQFLEGLKCEEIKVLRIGM
jgi:hypothetical protein